MVPNEKMELELRALEEPRTVEGFDGGFTFPEYLLVLANRKSFLFRFVSFVLALSAATVFVLPKEYTAIATIMPPQQNPSIALSASANQFGPLAALMGKDLGLRNPTDVYIAMLRSRTIEDALVDRFSLMGVYKKKLRVDARQRLEDHTEVAMGKGSTISILVRDRDPQRAADLANAYVDELEKITKTLNVTEAGKRRLFFEREVKMAGDDLASAEAALKQTQEKTGLIMLDGQSRAMIEALTALRAQVAAKEVEVRSMRSFATSENPDLVRAEQELLGLREQESKMELGRGKRSIADVPIENVPSAGLEYVRKFREVKYREALFDLLAKQYEAAKIDEARDSLIVQELDKAVRPEKHSWPKRALLIAAAGILALMTAIGMVLWSEEIRKAKADPQFAAQWHLFRVLIRGEKKS
jgi:uncharacterized protein involved in exopolysaccharide biosynthesis